MSSYQNGLISDFSDMKKDQRPMSRDADIGCSAVNNRGVFGTGFDSQLNAFGLEGTKVDPSTLEPAENLGTGITYVSTINTSGYLNLLRSYSRVDTQRAFDVEYDAPIPSVSDTTGYWDPAYYSYFGGCGPYNIETYPPVTTIDTPSILGNGFHPDVTHSSEPPLTAPSAFGAPYEAGSAYGRPDPAKATLAAPANLFYCNYPGCSKTYKRETWLTRHQEKHATITAFSCHHPGCSKTYGRQAELNRHVRRHGPCDEFRCEECDYHTDRRDHLSSHQKHKHRRTHKKHL